MQANVTCVATSNLSAQTAFAHLFASDSLKRAGGQSSNYFVVSTSWKF